MKSLLAKALLRYRGSEELALDDLAWGFRAYIRDPRQRFKPLGRLARTREEYGRAPPAFQAPWRRAEATTTIPHGSLPARPATSTPKRSGQERTGDGSGVGGAKPPTLLELARLNVKRAEEAQRLGFGTHRAVERAAKLLRELEEKQRS
jgi:hypothetical protein